eukprot:TRINITY_DN4367_c0_g1_i1.p1 TRINITY_DN4367_c0_g1~~TRINITY_DN4367_c0_g1_i1.p1  ORF type:complete len:115 (-),score=24.99 TRINITY_DN4367_c0_g1_i1:11-355(-)
MCIRDSINAEYMGNKSQYLEKMYYQALDENAIVEGVKKHGVAVGGRKMMDQEFLHAQEALESGIYMTYYCESKKSECSRVGSTSRCFCGHVGSCLLYTSPSPRDRQKSRMPSSA